jgi:riboflavin-specific deaminase-like protein
VTVKFAQTLDGRIATATGDSKWISSEPALRFAHQLRSQHDAVLVGVGTVLADDPQLNVRLAKGPDPRRVVVDGRLRTPPHSKILSNGAARTLIATSNDAPVARERRLERLGAEVLRIPRLSGERGLDLSELLRELSRRQIRSVLVEGGSEIITSLLNGGLVDRVVVVIAPKIIGKGLESIGDLSIKRLRDAITFSSIKVRRVGQDLVFDGTPAK